MIIRTSSFQTTTLDKLTTVSPSAINKMVDLVKYPIITQKTYIALFKNRQYTFDVDIRLTKPQIKKLFETLFLVNVVRINTLIPPKQSIRFAMSSVFKHSYKSTKIVILSHKIQLCLKYNSNGMFFCIQFLTNFFSIPGYDQ